MFANRTNNFPLPPFVSVFWLRAIHRDKSLDVPMWHVAALTVLPTSFSVTVRQLVTTTPVKRTRILSIHESFVTACPWMQSLKPEGASGAKQCLDGNNLSRNFCNLVLGSGAEWQTSIIYKLQLKRTSRNW
jgi:hypothetical protein